MKTEKYFSGKIKSLTSGFFTVRSVFFGLLFFTVSCEETTLKNERFPIEWIKKNSFERGSKNYLLTDYEINAKVDYPFYKNWLQDNNFEMEFCNLENITPQQRKEMKQSGYDDFCEYSAGKSYYLVDHHDSDDLFFFTIAEKYSPPAGYWNTSFYHFTFDKTKNKIIYRDFLTAVGGTEDGTSWKSDIELVNSSTNETVFEITETESEVLAEIDNYVYDSIIVKRKRMIFSKNMTVKELCDSVSYNMKSCENLDQE